MKKGIYQPPNIELGFKLIEFHRFWWIYVYAEVYQEKEARYQGRRGKKHIPPWNQVEGSRRHEKATHQRGAHLEATQVDRPHLRSDDPSGSHLSASSAS
jgi:hypothetical protein